MIVAIDLFVVLSGALAGAAAAHFARGRNRLLKAAAIGAVVSVVLVFLRRYI